MILDDKDIQRPNPRDRRLTPGWTSLHSWIFLAIVAFGVIVIGLQNRYHYLSPLGLGKAYRIDKLFGGIQEFEPGKGWIVAQLQIHPPQPPMSMMEQPPMPGAPPVPMHMPAPPSGAIEPRAAVTPHEPREEALAPAVQAEPPTRTSAVTPSRALEEPSMSKEERFKLFQTAFPDFGEDEFQLANDDLFPNWKKTVAPAGTWKDFIDVYKKFIKWWTDAGSPPEPGFKLWKDFIAQTGGGKN